MDFFPVNIVFPLYSGVSNPQVMIKNSSIFNLQLGTCGCGGPITLFYTILYKGLEHQCILVSIGVLEPILCRYQGLTAFVFVESKLYVDFQLVGVGGWCPKPPCCSKVNCTSMEGVNQG